MAGLIGQLQRMSIQDQDHIKEKIAEIHAELQEKAEEMMRDLEHADHELRFIDTSDEIIKAIQKMKVCCPEPHDVSVMPKKVRRGEEFKVIVCVRDEEGKIIYGGPVYIDNIQMDARGDKYVFTCHMDQIGDNTLAIYVDDRTFTEHIEVGDYSEELRAFLNKNITLGHLTDMTRRITHEISAVSKTVQESEKKYYTYLILDSNRIGSEFETFVAAVIYVGKGKFKEDKMENQRSHIHIRHAHLSQSFSAVSKHIKYLWDCGSGVIVLHAYGNIPEPEALTRETCMIQAIGTSVLTNGNRGMTKMTRHWDESTPKLTGVMFLYEAWKKSRTSTLEILYRDDHRFVPRRRSLSPSL